MTERSVIFYWYFLYLQKRHKFKPQSFSVATMSKNRYQLVMITRVLRLTVLRALRDALEIPTERETSRDYFVIRRIL